MKPWQILRALTIASSATVLFIGWSFIIAVMFRGRALESCIAAGWLTASSFWLHKSLFCNKHQ
jgi:hypothetical protein